MALSGRLRKPPPPTPKTYLYASDSKVNMLIEKLDHSLRDRFGLKAIKVGTPGVATAEIGVTRRDPSRYSRAERLCAALETTKGFGDLRDENAEYFRGQALAAWGFWNRYDEGYADVVFFTCLLDGCTVVGLGGSAYHTEERAEERLQQRSNSGLQMLMDFLKEQSENPKRRTTRGWGPPGAWPGETKDADHDNPVVPERVEFFAQRLLDTGEESGVRTIIGSPIYVARTGQPTRRREMKEYEELRNQFAIRHYNKPRLKSRHGDWQVGKPSSPRLAPLLDPDLFEVTNGDPG
jgi:hypothetical protein